MSTLAGLFDDDRATRDEFEPAAREVPSDAGLAEMLGGGGVDGVGVGGSRRQAQAPVDDTQRLVDLVQSAAADAAPVVLSGGGGGGKAKKSSRGHKRTDWLSVLVAVLAVGVVSGTAVFGGIQLASASPAADALQSLATDEAALVNAQQSLSATATRIEADVTAGREDAARLEPALVAVEGYSDEPARAAAMQALTDYRAGLDALVLPELPAPYSRPAIDEDSLADVGAAIDDVQARAAEMAEPTERMHALRGAVTDLRDRFVEQVAAFGATFPAWAATVNAENDQADQSFRDALTAAAAAVPSGQAGGLLGIEAMLVLPPLVDALREDNQRALDEIAAEEEAAEDAESGGSGGSDGSDWYVDPGVPPTDPGVPPTDPGVPPTDPGPVDPPVTDPPVTDPGTGEAPAG
ncbi:hypothetical protein NQ156_10725 [Microbacterium sp. zg.Y625]|uniref:hypothetical protein n=1 Tax=Microbacterium jiangjiandongii TaxID=3049071 RepID=UPI00214AE3CD|nr:MULTISPECIES: hypothetical protein [unclassified Microbacterium]MCR2793535.1 hypothetical protein [Microbacterium sp. zg.Y625]WIM25889.1 hypothetical protein QNO14_02210 [Microbacterium sp. zg-Y625]